MPGLGPLNPGFCIKLGSGGRLGNGEAGDSISNKKGKEVLGGGGGKC